MPGPVVEHDEPRADIVGGRSGVRRLDDDIADGVAGAAVRDLGVDPGVAQPGEAGGHQLAVVEEQRDMLPRIVLVDPGRRPVGSVLGEQVHPLLEPAVVEQPDLVDQEALDLARHQELGERPIARAFRRAFHQGRDIRESQVA